LYEEGRSVLKAVYEEKLTNFSLLTQPIEERVSQHKTFGEAIAYLATKVKAYDGIVEQNVSFLNKAMNFLHIKVNLRLRIFTLDICILCFF
jgi:hypothetical protein